MCTQAPPATPPPLAAAFDSLNEEQQRTALDLLARLITTLTPRPRPPHGNFPPARDPLPPMPPYNEGGAS